MKPQTKITLAESLNTLFGMLGVGAVVYGLSLAWVPLGWISGGCAAFAFALGWTMTRSKQDDPQ